LYSDGDKAFLKKTVEKQAPTANEPAASAASFYLFTGFGVLGAVMAVIGVVRGVGRSRRRETRTVEVVGGTQAQTFQESEDDALVGLLEPEEA